MNRTSLQFLGFAFASSDLAMELSPQGTIELALGAVSRLLGVSRTLEGAEWRELIAEPDQALVAAALAGLVAGERLRPIVVRIADTGKRAMFSACSLPELAPNVSCSLSLIQTLGAPSIQPDGSHGLYDAAGFAQLSDELLSSARAEGLELDVALLEMPGFAQLGDDGAQAKFAAAVRAESVGGYAAAQLSGDRFAVVRTTPDGVDQMGRRLKTAAHDAGLLAAPLFEAITLGGQAPAAESLRALRWALDSFLRSGLSDGTDVAAEVRRKIANTTAQATAFKKMVEAKGFSLVYQPIVSLTDGEVHHFEALARFSDGLSPFETIRMAEELELIEDFDLAVAREAIRALAADTSGASKIAVNMSAKSLMQRRFVDTLLELISGPPNLPARLLFEITESATLVDLACAEERIQSFRRLGFAVWLDDFGAGSASLAYLQALSVDGVKIDGQYVRELSSGRNLSLVRHIAGLCRELGVATVAEMVERTDTDLALKKLGINYGQGWFYGRPQQNLVFQKGRAGGVAA
ncbi:MAG: diguanylate phosphodiesterase [Acidimicrobiales bacterium]|nr:diguanylate phosphodiesterase [Acidimicrobiales bacterium]